MGGGITDIPYQKDVEKMANPDKSDKRECPGNLQMCKDCKTNKTITVIPSESLLETSKKNPCNGCDGNWRMVEYGEECEGVE